MESLVNSQSLLQAAMPSLQHHTCAHAPMASAVALASAGVSVKPTNCAVIVNHTLLVSAKQCGFLRAKKFLRPAISKMADSLEAFLHLSLAAKPLLRASLVYQAVWLWSAYANEQGYPQEQVATPDEAAVALVLAMKLRESRVCALSDFARSTKHCQRLERLELAMFDAELLANATKTQYDRLLSSAQVAHCPLGSHLDYCAELALFEPTLRCQALDASALVQAAQCLASSQVPALEQALALLECESTAATRLAQKYGVQRPLEMLRKNVLHSQENTAQ
jgi:hypothetical protein